MNKSALKALADGPVVQVLPESTAQPMIDSGHVRRATIDPMPKSGIPVSITAKGRGALAGPGGPTPPPPPPPPKD